MTTSTSEILTGARTMWELVDRRADASPDQHMLIAPDGETVTFGQFRDRAARVAAALHGMGVGTGSVVSWQLPTRIDSIVLSIALSRLGAVQNPIIHLYREREGRIRAASDRCGTVRHPGPVARRGLRQPRGARPRGCHHTSRRPQHRGRSSRGRPRRPSPATRGGRAGGRSDPLDLLHVRVDRRPQRRTAHRPDLDRGRMGPRPRCSIWALTTSAPSPSRSRTSRGRTIWSRCLPSGSRPSSWRPSPRRTCCPSSASTPPPWWGAAPPSTWPTSPSNARPRAIPSSPPCG